MQFTVLELNWINTELNNDTIVFLELLYSWICLIFDEVCVTDSVIFLFNTVKLLWNSLYCINIKVNQTWNDSELLNDSPVLTPSADRGLCVLLKGTFPAVDPFLRPSSCGLERRRQ